MPHRDATYGIESTSPKGSLRLALGVSVLALGIGDGCAFNYLATQVGEGFAATMMVAALGIGLNATIVGAIDYAKSS